METKRFLDKVVLVTGGNAGIGKATALAFAREGAKVIITARRENVGKEVVQEIASLGGLARFIRADMSSISDIESLFKTIEAGYGRLDCAFNNAGVGTEKPQRLHKTAEALWDSVIDTNLKGVWACMKGELALMVKHSSGAIVNNASMLGFIGESGSSIYVTSKHGLLGLTKSTALEYAEKNIRINAVCPGYIDTGMPGEVFKQNPASREIVLSRIPMHRLGKPDEIAGAVLWLCSGEASFMTGQTMVIDGGQSAA